MFTVVEKEEKFERIHSRTVACCVWEQDTVIEACEAYGMDVSEMSDEWWNGLTEWISNSEYFPTDFEDLVEEVKMYKRHLFDTEVVPVILLDADAVREAIGVVYAPREDAPHVYTVIEKVKSEVDNWTMEDIKAELAKHNNWQYSDAVYTVGV